MKIYYATLLNCRLFSGFSERALEELFNSLDSQLRDYARGSAIAFEGELCEHIGIVLEGQVELHNLYPSGRTVTVTHLGIGEIFGEAILFTAHRQYPISITATQKSKVLFIGRQALLKGLSVSPQLLENFLTLLSSKLLMLNRRVKILSMDSIRQKLCDYLISLYKKQKSKTLRMPVNRQKLADLLGVQRPSLSRELIHMKEEGLIEYDRSTITLLDLEGIEADL